MIRSDNTLSASPENALAHIFGVRHLSPMGAWQLRRMLDRVQPDLVMIEGLSDADSLIKDVTRKDSKPPIAILAYTDSVPVRTLVYPFAEYSPEYQAILWARENGKKATFIDLPSDVFLALQDVSQVGENGTQDKLGDEAAERADNSEEATQPPKASWLENKSLYQRIAEASGELDYDTFWERNFEHNLADDAYQQMTCELGYGLREIESDTRPDFAENLVREAFMRRRILAALKSGYSADKMVVVVGAFHAPVLTYNHPVMTDEEFNHLKRLSSKLTLMPYSFFRLSSQSGYGAGNEAPAYYQRLWESLESNKLDQLAPRYMTDLTRTLRGRGTHRSTAAVIEGVRLSRTLSALKNGMAPTLRDLQDAATSLIGFGDRGVIAECMAMVEVGTAVGRLPKGVSQTSIQEDFDRELERLSLEKYRTPVKTELALDLREKRSAKTEASAFLDLNRSSFFHRLSLLGVSFAKFVPAKQDSATWAEKWNLQWTPESEIQLVESVLLGETIELAAGFKFKNEIDSCKSIDRAAAIVRIACQCGMMLSMELARCKLQHLAADSSEFSAVASAATQLSHVVRFGDVRNYDASPLLPLIEDLFVQGALSLFDSSNCDNDAAKKLVEGIDQLNKVAQEHHDLVDGELWHARLKRLSDADDRNPILSGYACAVLLEDNLLTNEELAREVSRRLSPGIEADLGAGWFEGMASRNRYALLARQALWAQLADYVEALDEEQFRRALVFLRRAFGSFSPQEKRAICENLGHFWGVDEDAASELLSGPLTEAEEESLGKLNEFDFDDF